MALPTSVELRIVTPERLLVSEHRGIVHARRGRVSVRTLPPNPYARVMLELRLRDRFGWWPQRFERLDYLSRASFRVNRRVRARVSLVDKDGWTVRTRDRRASAHFENTIAIGPSGPVILGTGRVAASFGAREAAAVPA